METEDSGNSPYAGRWIARVRGKVVAQGASPEEARLAAKAYRHKEKLEIVYMLDSTGKMKITVFDEVLAAIPEGQEIFLVGGAVRDMLMGRTSHDFDFAVPTNGIRLGRRVANKLNAAFYPLDDERDTGRVILSKKDGRRIVIDFVAYRGKSLDEDLRARDFTINSLAFDLRHQTLTDPLNGAQDIQNKVVRVDSETSFTDDPVRVLRAVRQAAELGFQIDPDTRQKMKRVGAGLRNVSPERLRDELFRILEGRKPGSAIRALEMLGVLPYILPELPTLKGVEQSHPHVYDVWTHTVAVLRHLENNLSVLAPGYDPESTGDLFTSLLVLKLGRYRERFADHFANAPNADRSGRALLFLAALYHDIAKPDSYVKDDSGRIRFWGHDERGARLVSKRAEELNLSNQEVERLRTVVKNHMRILFHSSRLENEGKTPSRKALYRFFRDTGEASVDLVLLALADTRATHGHELTEATWSAVLDVCRIFLENYWEKPEETVAPPSLLNGHQLMSALDLKPSPKVGELLEAIREAQATGKISIREEALTFAREQLNNSDASNHELTK
jgi:tRNA nucleotidyltransferase/poly(A) polymerase